MGMRRVWEGTELGILLFPLFTNYERNSMIEVVSGNKMIIFQDSNYFRDTK